MKTLVTALAMLIGVAKAKRRGIWASELAMPRDWRKMMRGNDASGDCRIKGKINVKGEQSC